MKKPLAEALLVFIILCGIMGFAWAFKVLYQGKAGAALPEKVKEILPKKEEAPQKAPEEKKDRRERYEQLKELKPIQDANAHPESECKACAVKNPYKVSKKKPERVNPRKAGSYFDFISHEYQSILKWECNTLGKKPNGMVYCKKPETYLPDNDEFNVMGLLQHTNPECHRKFYQALFNGTHTATGYSVASSGEDIVKRCYYNNYFKKYRDLPKCVRLFMFEMSVLAGHKRAAITLQRTLGVKADGIIGPVTLGKIKGSLSQLDKLREQFIKFLKSINKPQGNLWEGWVRKDGSKFSGYKNGWGNRLNFDYNRSVSFCSQGKKSN